MTKEKKLNILKKIALILIISGVGIAVFADPVFSGLVYLEQSGLGREILAKAGLLNAQHISPQLNLTPGDVFTFYQACRKTSCFSGMI